MNASVRNRLRKVAYYFLRFVTVISYLFVGKSKKVPILVYHRICPLHYKKDIPYANVYPEVFDRQMNYLQRHFEVITVSDYLRRASADLLKGNELCITFDDGFKDNYLYAYPILKKYGLRATFFLTTEYIGGDNLFAWMPLDKGAKEDIEVNRANWLPLSWDEVREMMEYGMEFGTHTHTHRDSLSKMSEEEAKAEIERSTAAFREKTGIQPEVFSYPHGTFKDYDATHIEILKSLKYKAALTTNIGRNDRFQDPYELKRIIIYEMDSPAEFKRKISGAYDVAEVFQRIWLNLAGSRPYKSTTCCL